MNLVATLGIRLRTAAHSLLSRRDDELGREQEQTLVRCAVVLLIGAYLAAFLPQTDARADLPGWFLYSLSYFAISVAVSILTFRTTSSSRLRWSTMNVADAATISYLMIATGEIGTPLFVLYLWITIGNGFRFGLKAMGVSIALCMAGFAVVVALSPQWRTHPILAGSVFFALLALPIYVAHLIALLNKALAKIARHQLVAQISHELKTPLRSIIGATELLGHNQRLTPEERSLLGVVRDSVHLSLKQIENALDLSALESGGPELEPVDFDLHQAVNTAAEMIRPSASQKGQRLLIRITPQTPYRLRGDARRLRDVLLHLLSNAVKHAPGGLVCLDITSHADTQHQVTVRFEVRNSGVAVAARTTDGEGRSDGDYLGTTIASQLVELMGGRVGIERLTDLSRLCWFELQLTKQPIVGDDCTKMPGVRALLLSQDNATIDHFRHVLVQAEGLLLPTSTDAEALDLLTRAIRLGNPVHALLIDASLGLTPEGEHRFAELNEKALSANVSTILISDVVPAADRLRTFGYSAVLSRHALAQHILAALHAIPLLRFAANQGVVNVAPWLWTRRDARRPRILLADDNKTNLMIVRRMLEQAGYEVDEKQTGTEALESLCEGNYRLAILDMHMPDMSGISVLRHYRLRRPRSRLPTIVLTANVSLDAQQQSADAGADAYLAKPVTTADLLNEVERLIRESEVEVLSPAARSVDNDFAKNEVVLRIEVLAELDRLYQNPRGLAQVIEGYRHEGDDLLEKIEKECHANNHAAFGEWIRALKSNAANMGAVKLMRACSDIETIGPIEFKRENLQSLARLKGAFKESLQALDELVHNTRPSSLQPGD